MSSEETFATAYGGFYPGAGRLYPGFDSCLSMVVRGLVDMNHQTRHLRTVEFIYGRSKNVYQGSCTMPLLTGLKTAPLLGDQANGRSALAYSILSPIPAFVVPMSPQTNSIGAETSGAETIANLNRVCTRLRQRLTPNHLSQLGLPTVPNFAEFAIFAWSCDRDVWSGRQAG